MPAGKEPAGGVWDIALPRCSFLRRKVASVAPLRGLLRVGPYIEQLGMFSTPWTLSAFALTFVLLYTVLRILHNLELYRYVAENVRHLSVGDAFAATIFEVLIESNVLLSREPVPRQNGIRRESH